MRFDRLLQCISFQYLLVSISAHGETPEVHNANHLFNAIHSSMRQWGESLNHNGMSFFLATVPASTQLYHGTWRSKAIQGLEWLAFEPEHARIFANPRPKPRPPPDRDDGTRKGREPPIEISMFEEGLMNDRLHRDSSNKQQQSLGMPDAEPKPWVGYLHTYCSKHDLSLLYIDGTSAGKTSNGTLDSQDMLILNSTVKGGMAGEYERAQGMCNLASTLWEGRIDGIVRMESGFEIILCDFERHLDLEDVMAVTSHRGQEGFLGGWSYIKAITSRYQSLGGDRVSLNYENFVSVFAYPDIEGVFDNDAHSDYAMPRLQNVKVADLMRVRRDITSMILRNNGQATRNWQTVADMVVARYSKPLHYLHTDKKLRLDKEAFQDYLELFLSPFVDNTARNSTLETRRCVAQVAPAQSNTSLASRSIYAITVRICTTLLEALAAVSPDQEALLDEAKNAADAIKLIDDLFEYLQWTTWKECGTCPDEQICYIPIWPMGKHEDHKQPRCRTEDEARSRWGYWGFA